MSVAALAICGCSTLPRAHTQKTAPNREIFLAPFREGEKTTWRFAFLVAQSQGVKVGKPVNITNHPGDDTHPSFLPDSSGVLFLSSRDGGAGGYRYDIATKAVAALRPEIGPVASDTGGEAGRTPAGSKVIGRRSRLLIWQEAEDHWIQIVDARKAKVVDITNVAVSPDGKWIAFAATVTRR